MKSGIAFAISCMAVLHTMFVGANNVSVLTFEKLSTEARAGGTLTLVCTSQDYAPSSLGIYMKYDNESLTSSTKGTALVYHIEGLRCSHMGTYFCRHNKWSYVNSSQTVQVEECAPQLCPGEIQKQSYSCHEKATVFTLCIISPYDFDLKEVFHKSDPLTKVNGSRYEVNKQPQKPRGLYYIVDVRIHDITQRDCGTLTLAFQNEYDKTLYYDLELSGPVFRHQSPQKVLVFTSEVWDPRLKEWTVSTAFPRGSIARLVCSDGMTQGIESTLKIRKSTEENHLPHNATGLQVIHIFANTDCDIMGTYICEDEEDMRKTLNVGIFDCEPRLCNGDETHRIIFAPVDETLDIPLCVTAYPDVDMVELVESLTKARTSGGSTRWISSTKKTAFSTYEVILSFKNVTENDVGMHVVGIFTTYKGKQRQLNYSVELKLEGPPECPSDIQISNQGTENIILSWQPGSHGGAGQMFRVYISKENDTTAMSPVETGGDSLNITDLKAGGGYAFTVVSYNRFTQHVDKTRCNNTVYYHAEQDHPDAVEHENTTVPVTDEDNNIFTKLYGQIAFGVILLNVFGVAAIVGILFCGKKGCRPWTRRNDRQIVSYKPEDTNDDACNCFINTSSDPQDHIYAEIV